MANDIDQIATTDAFSKIQPQTNSTAVSIDDPECFPEKKLPAGQDEAQEGVREVEAVTLSWTKQSLVTAFVW